MKDLDALHDIIKIALEELGAKDPAFIVSFTTDKDRQEVHWVSNISRGDSIKILESLAERMKAQLN